MNYFSRDSPSPQPSRIKAGRERIKLVKGRGGSDNEDHHFLVTFLIIMIIFIETVLVSQSAWLNLSYVKKVEGPEIPLVPLR
jgi:hypothetical protein